MNNLTNLTDWEYPVSVHQSLCDLLRINPRVWILPDDLRELFSEHLDDSDMANTEAFADEFNNIVFFYTPSWSPEYRQWLIFHEMFHSKQYFDHGNAAGDRWDGMTSQQQEVAWEREANDFADKFGGSGKIDKDFKRYVKLEPPKKKTTRKKPKK